VKQFKFIISEMRNTFMCAMLSGFCVDIFSARIIRVDHFEISFNDISKEYMRRT